MNRWITFAAVGLACAFGARLTATPAGGRVSVAGQELPAGAGKAIIAEVCASSCHGIERFATEHRSKSQWIETIQTMKDAGAAGTDADFKSILGYLVAHSGIQIKINAATAKQIDDAMDLETGQAEAIVKYRDEHGKFADWQDLMKVPGLDAKKLDEQKPNVIYQ